MKAFKEKTDRSYKYHSVQLNVGREKDYSFMHLQEMIPDGIIYSEIIGEEIYKMLGSTYTKKIDKYGRENEPHITVCYGLYNENDYFAIRRYLSNYRKFRLYLGEISYFSDDTKPFDVCKIEVDSPDLHRINSFIRTQFKVKSSYPEYNPHLTLAYIQKGYRRRNGQHPYVGKEIICDKMLFSHIEGYKLELPLKD
jgi:2'-5' RNA ligase